MRLKTTILFSPEVDKVMREKVFSKKGNLSKFVEEAVKEKLERDYGVKFDD